MYFIYEKNPTCIFCRKTLAETGGRVQGTTGGWDHNYGKEIKKDGIYYVYPDKYWHTKCALDNQPNNTLCARSEHKSIVKSIRDMLGL